MAGKPSQWAGGDFSFRKRAVRRGTATIREDQEISTRIQGCQTGKATETRLGGSGWVAKVVGGNIENMCTIPHGNYTRDLKTFLKDRIDRTLTPYFLESGIFRHSLPAPVIFLTSGWHLIMVPHGKPVRVLAIQDPAEV